MIKLFFFLTLMTLCFNSFSREIEAEFSMDDSDMSLLQKIEEVIDIAPPQPEETDIVINNDALNIEELDILLEKEIETGHSNNRSKKLTIITPAPIKSNDDESFLANLSQGSILNRVDNQKPIKLPKSTLVKLRSDNLGHHFYYILDHNNQAKYKVHQRFVTLLRNDLTLFPNANYSIDQTKKNKGQVLNIKGLLENELSYDYKVIDNNYLRYIFDDENVTSSGQALSYQVFYQSSIPLLLGLNLSGEQGVINNQDGDQSSWLYLSYGPRIKYVLKNGHSHRWGVHALFNRSLSYKINTPDKVYGLHSNEWGLGVSLDYDSYFGKYFVRLEKSYRYVDINNAKSGATILNNSDRIISVMSLSLGFKFNISL